MKKQILVVLVLLSSFSTISAQWIGTTAYSPIYGRLDSAFPSVGLGYYSLQTNHTNALNGGITFQYLSEGTLKDGLTLNAFGHVISNGPFFGRLNSQFPNPGIGYYSLLANNTNASNGGLTIQRLSNGSFTDALTLNGFGQIIANGDFIGRLDSDFPINDSVGYYALNTNHLDGFNGGLTIQRLKNGRLIDALALNGNDQIIANGSLIGRLDSEFPSIGLGYYALNTNHVNNANGGLTIQYLKDGNFVDGFIMNYHGDIGVGTSPNSLYKLNVEGTIHAREMLIDNYNWSDFVFDKTYLLPSIKEVDKFIQTNGHLPNIPTAQEVKENGTNVAEIQSKLLQKIEELTLYVIEQDKKIDLLQKQIENK